MRNCGVPSLDPVVSNTTPLITLVGIGLLDLLPALYQEIQIPTAVFTEYQAGRSHVPSSPDLATLSWLTVHTVTPDPAVPTTLDSGEAEAIALARAHHARLILLDERTGRIVALRLGLPVAGSLAVLLQAKQQGLIPLVAPLLDQMVQQGRRISPQLRALVLTRAGE
jgi:uncharacterized protein